MSTSLEVTLGSPRCTTNLLALAEQYRWRLKAWAEFSNHYHFVAHAMADASSLKTILSHLHSTTATSINQLDGEFGRDVWHNF